MAIGAAHSPTGSEANGGDSFIDAAGAEEEVAKAHKLEFIGRLVADSADGRAAYCRITDCRAAAEVIAVRLGQARERLRWRTKLQLVAIMLNTVTIGRDPGRHVVRIGNRVGDVNSTTFEQRADKKQQRLGGGVGL